jgi:hypothetical protein
MFRSARWIIVVSLLVFAGLVSGQAEIPLVATKHLFPEMGPGLLELKYDAAAHRYLVLSSRSAGVAVYNQDGQRMGTIPPAAASANGKPAPSTLQFPSDFDITSDGRIVIADRAANALRFYDSAGALVQSISTPTPGSIAALPEGEVAVVSSAFATPRNQASYLITVYNASGGVARTFGDFIDLASRTDLNRFLNIGRVSSDASGALYYAFTYHPEPTVRKFDRFGYSSLEISITSLDVQPVAQAVRREIKRQDDKGGGAPHTMTIINALGVDPESHEFWLALGNVILHLNRDGGQIAAYRAYSADGIRLEPVAILVEPERLLFACDPLGVFELPRPDKKKP